jgi:hypothetical protein
MSLLNQNLADLVYAHCDQYWIQSWICPFEPLSPFSWPDHYFPSFFQISPPIDGLRLEGPEYPGNAVYFNLEISFSWDSFRNQVEYFFTLQMNFQSF